MSAPTELTAYEARALMERGELTARELTEATLARIAAVEPQVKSFLTVTPEQALAQADFNCDGHVNILDLGLLADSYNQDGAP